MNPKLIQFIELCLVDGVISDKEREIIFRKSKELGVPDDECEIILEGMIQKLGKKSSSNVLDEDTLVTIDTLNEPEVSEKKSDNKREKIGPDKSDDSISEYKSIEIEGIYPTEVNSIKMSTEDSRLIEEFDHRTKIILDTYSSQLSKCENDRFETNQKVQKNDSFFNRNSHLNKLNQKERKEIPNFDEDHSIDIYQDKRTGWYFTTDGRIIFDLRICKFFTGEDRWSNEVNYSHWTLNCMNIKSGNTHVPEVFESYRFLKKNLLIPVGDEVYIQVPNRYLNHVDDFLLGYETYLNNQIKLLPELKSLDLKFRTLSIRIELTKTGLELIKSFISKYHSNFILEINKYVDDSLSLIKKHQTKINEDKYLHNLVQMTNRLKDIRKGLNELKSLIINYDLENLEKSNRKVVNGIIFPNEDQEDNLGLEEMISEFEDGLDNYSRINYFTLCMVTSLVENDKITFLQIYEQFDRIGVFNSNWENSMLEGVEKINRNIDHLTHSVYMMNNSISTKLNKLNDLTQSSFEGLRHSITKELQSINSSVNFNNLLTGIQSYEMYKINKNTKSLRG